MFVARNNLKSPILHGEAGSIDDEAVAEAMKEVREICQNYAPDNIFNVDEIGLSYKLLPWRTFLAHGEHRKRVRAVNYVRAKDHISVTVCTNATGTRNVPLSIIGTAQDPSCFRFHQSPLT